MPAAMMPKPLVAPPNNQPTIGMPPNTDCKGKQDFGENYDTQSGDTWYRACSDLTLSDEQWGVLPNGVVSSSGFGDGSYQVFGYKDAYDKYVAFAVVFIEDEEEE